MTITPKPHYAHFFARLFAFVIDAVILLPIGALIGSIFGQRTFFEALVGLVVTGTYYVAFLVSSWQATPGKRLIGMYVTNQDGSSLNRQQAIERFLAFLMPQLPIYSSLDPNSSYTLIVWLMTIWFLPIALTDQKTGLHDLLCRTRVVYGRPEDRKRQS